LLNFSFSLYALLLRKHYEFLFSAINFLKNRSKLIRQKNIQQPTHLFIFTKNKEMEFELSGHGFIELNKLLKLLNLVESGGQAHTAISKGDVLLNGKTESRKRKKLFKGDLVEYLGVSIEIV
jgi:ribosome-associated protein